MNQPTCPQDYTCTFTLVKPRVIEHTIGPWWQGGWGVVVAIIAIVAIACVLTLIVYQVCVAVSDKRDRLERAAERKQKLDMQEQFTMQLNEAAGNPEMLKIVHEWQR